jgi:hypothetical protein
MPVRDSARYCLAPSPLVRRGEGWDEEPFGKGRHSPDSPLIPAFSPEYKGEGARNAARNRARVFSELALGFPAWREPLPVPVMREFKNPVSLEVQIFETPEPEWPRPDHAGLLSPGSIRSLQVEKSSNASEASATTRSFKERKQFSRNRDAFLDIHLKPE